MLSRIELPNTLGLIYARETKRFATSSIVVFTVKPLISSPVRLDTVSGSGLCSVGVSDIEEILIRN